jgi:hypothetical protein
VIGLILQEVEATGVDDDAWFEESDMARQPK